jgi:hypothetical protein
MNVYFKKTISTELQKMYSRRKITPLKNKDIEDSLGAEKQLEILQAMMNIIPKAAEKYELAMQRVSYSADQIQSSTKTRKTQYFYWTIKVIT